jgi:hypothetical protein
MPHQGELCKTVLIQAMANQVVGVYETICLFAQRQDVDRPMMFKTDNHQKEHFWSELVLSHMLDKTSCASLLPVS